MLSVVCHPVVVVRSSAALAALLEDNRRETGQVLVQLLDMYQVGMAVMIMIMMMTMMMVLLLMMVTTMMQDKLEMSPAEVDSQGGVVVEAVDHWEPRSGIGLASWPWPRLRLTTCLTR